MDLRCVRRLSIHAGERVLATTDPACLVIGTPGEVVMQTGGEEAWFAPPDGTVHRLRLADEGTSLLAAPLRLDLDTGDWSNPVAGYLPAHRHQAAVVLDADWTPDAAAVLVAAEVRTDHAPARELVALLDAHGSGGPLVELDQVEGHRTAVASDEVLIAGSTRLRVWRTLDRELLLDTELDDGAILDAVPVGADVVVATAGGKVSVVRVPDGTVAATWQAHERNARRLAWLPAAQALVTGGDFVLRAWQADGARLASVEVPGRVTALAVRGETVIACVRPEGTFEYRLS